MEIVLTAFNITLIGGLLILPIPLLKYINRKNLKYKFAAYLIIGFILTAMATFSLAWWFYTSDLLLLQHYGYNIDGMNHTEFYGNVLQENMDKVKKLEASIMSIGWQLKAFLTFVFYTPYLLIVYAVSYFINLNNQKFLGIKNNFFFRF